MQGMFFAVGDIEAKYNLGHAIALLLLLVAGVAAVRLLMPLGRSGSPPDRLLLIAHPKSPADRIVNGAQAEARRGVPYDASYRQIRYPGGDVAPDRPGGTPW